MPRYARVLLVAAWILPSAAAADVIPMDREACDGKKAGDACELGGESGKCADSTCTKNDYSDGVPPKSVSYDCVVCEVGEAEALAAVKPEAEDAKAEDAKAEDAKAEDAESDGEKAEDSKPSAPQAEGKKVEEAKKGCSIGGTAPAWLGLLLGVGLWRRRR